MNPIGKAANIVGLVAMTSACEATPEPRVAAAQPGGGKPVSAASYETTKTEFVEVNGARYAYRRFGQQSQYPLVLLHHFRASMDNWDPALLDALAREPTVIAFDNKGVSSSSGETPESFKTMADDAAEFIGALGYKKVDVLGFSIGGVVAQELLMGHPDLVRRAILAGTAAQGGDSFKHVAPEISAIAGKPTSELEDFLVLFFEQTPTSQAAGRAFIERRRARTVDPEPPSSPQTMAAQRKAARDWAVAGDPEFARLKTISHPVLVANGHHDRMIPTADSVLLYTNLPNAQLVLYPDSGHGFLFQFHDLFAEHVSAFLR